MTYRCKKWVRPEDLNAHETLFGGRLLSWIDEEAALFMIDLLGHSRVVTKFISEIDFVSSARKADVIELAFSSTAFGRTSITLRCDVTNIMTKKRILTINRMVFVSLDEAGQPQAHGRAPRGTAALAG